VGGVLDGPVLLVAHTGGLCGRGQLVLIVVEILFLKFFFLFFVFCFFCFSEGHAISESE